MSDCKEHHTKKDRVGGLQFGLLGIRPDSRRAVSLSRAPMLGET